MKPKPISERFPWYNRMQNLNNLVSLWWLLELRTAQKSHVHTSMQWNMHLFYTSYMNIPSPNDLYCIEWDVKLYYTILY